MIAEARSMAKFRKCTKGSKRHLFSERMTCPSVVRAEKNILKLISSGPLHTSIHKLLFIIPVSKVYQRPPAG